MRYLASQEKAVRGTFDFPIELYYVDSAHPRYEMPFHWHMECEMILVLEGSFLLSVNGEDLLLTKGQSAFIPGGAVHGGRPQNCVYECVVFEMERFLHPSAARLQVYRQTLGGGLCIQRLFEAGSAAGQILDALFETMEKEQKGYEFITTGLLWQWIGTVLQKRLYTQAEGAGRGHSRAEQIKRALRRIRNDYASPLTLAELAAEAGLSPQYFCRAFRQVTGRTPVDYLNYYRVECAAELLCSTCDSVTEIALACGFNELSYFIRLFTRYKKMPPGQFRKQHI